MWHIFIHVKALDSLKHLTKDVTKVIFIFLNENLPKDLSAPALTTAKVKTLKGIYLFPKESPLGMIHIFTHIEFEKKVIKVLHFNLQRAALTKKQKSKKKTI